VGQWPTLQSYWEKRFFDVLLGNLGEIGGCVKFFAGWASGEDFGEIDVLIADISGIIGAAKENFGCWVLDLGEIAESLRRLI